MQAISWDAAPRWPCLFMNLRFLVDLDQIHAQLSIKINYQIHSTKKPGRKLAWLLVILVEC